MVREEEEERLERRVPRELLVLQDQRAQRERRERRDPLRMKPDMI